MTDLSDYVDLEKDDPNLQDYTCWNCGYEGQDRIEKQKGAIICRECFHGQGENKTDYIELWYPNQSRESWIETQKQLREEARMEYRESNPVTVRV